jgi:hypothetical protein
VASDGKFYSLLVGPDGYDGFKPLPNDALRVFILKTKIGTERIEEIRILDDVEKSCGPTTVPRLFFADLTTRPPYLAQSNTITYTRGGARFSTNSVFTNPQLNGFQNSDPGASIRVETSATLDTGFEGNNQVGARFVLTSQPVIYQQAIISGPLGNRPFISFSLAGGMASFDKTLTPDDKIIDVKIITEITSTENQMDCFINGELVYESPRVRRDSSQADCRIQALTFAHGSPFIVGNRFGVARDWLISSTNLWLVALKNPRNLKLLFKRSIPSI